MTKYRSIKLIWNNGEVTTLSIDGPFFKHHDKAMGGWLTTVVAAGLQKTEAPDGTIVELY